MIEELFHAPHVNLGRIFRGAKKYIGRPVPEITGESRSNNNRGM